MQLTERLATSVDLHNVFVSQFVRNGVCFQLVASSTVILSCMIPLVHLTGTDVQSNVARHLHIPTARSKALACIITLSCQVHPSLNCYVPVISKPTRHPKTSEIYSHQLDHGRLSLKLMNLVYA